MNNTRNSSLTLPIPTSLQKCSIRSVLEGTGGRQIENGNALSNALTRAKRRWRLYYMKQRTSRKKFACSSSIPMRIQSSTKIASLFFSIKVAYGSSHDFLMIPLCCRSTESSARTPRAQSCDTGRTSAAQFAWSSGSSVARLMQKLSSMRAGASSMKRERTSGKLPVAAS
ncbi:MAG: hypothetical protein ACE5I1_17400 [bacterium]